jgi:hypothetical protein
MLVEKICKMQHLEGSGTPVLYIGGMVLKGLNVLKYIQHNIFSQGQLYAALYLFSSYDNVTVADLVY